MESQQCLHIRDVVINIKYDDDDDLSNIRHTKCLYICDCSLPKIYVCSMDMQIKQTKQKKLCQ